MSASRLHRKDLIFLPVLALLTVCFLSGFTELIARKMFTKTATVGEDCMIFNDHVTGPRGRPNSVCWEKIPEGELTEYKFDSSGYRDDVDCRHKAPGTFRIVMIGTSFTIGMRVPEEKTFAALLPPELSRKTGRKIDIYNEAIPYRFPDTIANHFSDVLAAQPDMILWALNAKDIQRSSVATLPASNSIDDQTKNLSLLAKLWYRLHAELGARSLDSLVPELFTHTRTYTLLMQVLYGSPSQYVKSTLMDSDADVGYLRREPSEEWQRRLKDFHSDAAAIEAQAKAANVPLVIVLLPNHAEAAMISLGEWPAGYDPYKLDQELNSITTDVGATYIDMFPDVRGVPNPEKGFFPVEGHPNARGHEMFSDLLAKELTNGAVPGLKAISSN